MKAPSTPYRALALASLVLVSLLGAACPSGPGGSGGGRRDSRPPSAADLQGIELVPMEITPSGPPAKKYGEKVDHALTNIEQAVVDALDAADLPVAHTPPLSRMLRELAASAPDHNTIPSSLIDGLMAWAGLVDPSPRLVMVELPQDPEACHTRMSDGCRPAVASLVEQVRATLPEEGPIAIGVGVAATREGKTRMIVGVLERAVELDPLPVAVGRQGSFSVSGRLLGRRREPWIEVVGPSGGSATLRPPVAANGRFSARVGCDDGPGAYQLEVMANGRYGVEVTANFPVYCGMAPPDSIPVVIEQLDPSVTPEQIARANFLYLNEERRARGLPPLEWAENAAVIARAHSQDMLENEFVGHTSPTTGDTTARYVAAGLRMPVIRENVARGYGPKGIHESLMNSPGHRVNILATDVTHVGVGVVVGEPETDLVGAARPVLATQNFYRDPKVGAPTKDLAPALQARVDEVREQAKLAPVRWNESLSAIAQRIVDARARGRAEPKGWHEEIAKLGFGTVESHTLSSADFEAIVKAGLWSKLSHDVGLGVVLAEESGDEVYIAVVLVAERP
jgi:uncharacterized protein YkwD